MPTREARHRPTPASDWPLGHGLGPLIGRDGGTEMKEQCQGSGKERESKIQLVTNYNEKDPFHPLPPKHQRKSTVFKVFFSTQCSISVEH